MTRYVLFLFLFIGVITDTQAQVWSESKGCVVDASGECIPNTLITAMPFLRIVPEARGGGMGDAGLATSPDANAMHYNASKLAFAEQPLSLSASYSPWLRNLGLQDIYLAYLTGYYKIDDLQAIGFGLRYFSLGEIPFTDENGMSLGNGNPNEFEIAGAYARKLGDNLAASVTAKFIYSNLAADQVVGGFEVSAATAFAADLGITYKKDYRNSAGLTNTLTIGGAITNIGSKVSYIKDVNKDFLPGNIGVGAAYEFNFDEYNALTLTAEINKLLIPTPIPVRSEDPPYDGDNDGVADHRQKTLFEGVFGSFGDATGGFEEEIQELMYTLGLEYWYDDQFAVRTGYFYEHPLKGARQYLTFGLGIKYNVFGMNLSYLIPTNNQQSPLANTLRFSLIFDFEAFTGAGEEIEE